MSTPSQQPLTGCAMQLCVLSSSSGGNCTALLVGEGDSRALILVDLGLSPRRTRRLLAQVGLGGVPIAGAILTHLDADHWRPTWVSAMPEAATIFVHEQHRGRAGREGVTFTRTAFYAGALEVPGPASLRARIATNPHDDLGSASFMFECDASDGRLGFATDVGAPSRALIDTLRGVNVLAIESNYCPLLQEASGRPPYLKRRIMGGYGHLSNEQSAGLVRDVAPSSHVVLLHLSRECNRPEVALRHHRHGDLPVTVARPDCPTPWIPVCASGPVTIGVPTPRYSSVPATLFD